MLPSLELASSGEACRRSKSINVVVAVPIWQLAAAAAAQAASGKRAGGADGESVTFWSEIGSQVRAMPSEVEEATKGLGEEEKPAQKNAAIRAYLSATIAPALLKGLVELEKEECVPHSRHDMRARLHI